MGISIGGVNLLEEAVDSRYRLAVLERIVDHLVRANPGAISQADVKRYQEEALSEIQGRFPDAGVTRK